MAVYGYCRVSTQQMAEEGESLGVQERKLAGWCMIDGSELTEVLIERGVSGAKPIGKRPVGAELMKKLRPGDTVVSTKLDRLFRSASDALNTVEKLKAKGIRIVAIDLGDITGNGLAKVILTVSAAFAEFEREQVVERVTSVKADQRARGRYLGGIVPLGYEVVDGELVPKDNEQAIIAMIRAKRAEGATLRAISAFVLAVHGRKLSLDAISRIAAG